MKVYIFIGVILLFLTYSPATTFALGTFNFAWCLGKQIFTVCIVLIIAYIIFVIYYLHYALGYYFAGLRDTALSTENIQPQFQFEGYGDRDVTASGDHDGEYFDFPEILMPEGSYAYDAQMTGRQPRVRRPRMLSTMLNRDSVAAPISMTQSQYEVRQALYEQFWTPIPSPTESRSRSESRSPSPMMFTPRSHENSGLLPTSLNPNTPGIIPQLELSTNLVQMRYGVEEESTMSMPTPEQPMSMDDGLGRDERIHDPAAIINLHQFPRGVTKPCLSSDGMYLETFMRLTGITYNVTFDCKTLDGPFISVDEGHSTTQVSGVNDCMKLLKDFYHERIKMYSVNGHLQVESYSISLTLDHLSNCLKAWRWVIENAEELRLHQPGWNEICKDFELQSRKVRNQLWTKGFSNKSDLELCQEVAKDFGDLSMNLGSNPFFLGESPTEIDCIAFGILCQVMWGHADDSILKKELEAFTSLDHYCNRIRELLWPDWNNHLSPGPKSENFNKINLSPNWSDEERDHFSETFPMTDNSTRFCSQYYQLVPDPEIEDCESITTTLSPSVCNHDPVLGPSGNEELVVFCTRCKDSQQPHPQLYNPIQLIIPESQNYIDDEFNDMQKISYSSHVGGEKDKDDDGE